MVGWLVSAILYLWELFKVWASTIFIVPFKNTDMLWLLGPIWIAWFFAEFFQEKVGTSLGNAITNSVVVLWAGIDCTRQTVRLLAAGMFKSTAEIIFRFALLGFAFAYSITIIVLGIKGNKIIKYFGRIRVVTYAFVMYVPVFYNAIPLSWSHFFASVLFFPLFYGVIELLDHIIPDPKAVIKDRFE